MKYHTDTELFNSILRAFLLLHEKKNAKISCLVMLCQVKLLGAKKSQIKLQKIPFRLNKNLIKVYDYVFLYIYIYIYIYT